MPQGHQQQVLHLSSRITYSLRAGKCHKAISNRSCIYQEDHLLPEDRQIPEGHQQQLLHLSNRITYSLRADKCHKSISKSSCTYHAGSPIIYFLRAHQFQKVINNSSSNPQMGSLTYLGQINATRPSATALASIKQDHLLPEGRQMPQSHQQQLLQLSHSITYFLRVCKYQKAISNSSCNYHIASLTF